MKRRFLAVIVLSVLCLGQGCPEATPEPQGGGGDTTPGPQVAVATPTCSPVGGTAIPASGLDVTLSCATSGAAIRYTTDGSMPTSSSGNLYSGVIHLTAAATIRAIAYADGMLDSEVVEAEYAPAPSVSATTLDDGHKIYNVAADFIAYADQAQSADTAGRRSQWEQMLEAKYPTFFDEIVYGGLTGTQRDDYKTQVINQFWSDVVPQLDTLRQVTDTAVQKVIDGRPLFRNLFPDFNPQADYYLTVSFDFVGKASAVSGQKAEFLALNAFAPDDPELDITIAHEHYHLHHHATFSPSGGLYRGVWSEGMAVYASTVIWPGYRLSQYLGFTGSAIDSMHDLFSDLTADIMTNIDSSDQTIKRAYLGTEPNNTWIPPGSGYYVGFYLVQAIVDQGNSFTDMTAWEATPTVHRAMVETLPTLPVP